MPVRLAWVRPAGRWCFHSSSECAAIAIITRSFRSSSLCRPTCSRGRSSLGGRGSPAFLKIANISLNSSGSSSSNMASSRPAALPSAAGVFPTVRAARVLAISDLHVDYKENLQLVQSWDSEEYRHDAIIVAGDVTDNLQLLESTLRLFKRRFAHVFFVPGNHELWIRPKEVVKDSIVKFKNILKICDRIGVHTRPVRVALSAPRPKRTYSTSSWHETSLSDVDSDNESDAGSSTPSPVPTSVDDVTDDDVMEECPHGHVWIVPLFSWYAMPEEDMADSLYVKPTFWKEDPRACDKMWMDNHLCKWPSTMPGQQTKSQYFASLNEEFLRYAYEGPVVTFSHVLPRQDLLKPGPEDQAKVNKERRKKGLGEVPPFKGVPGGFNFTRFAGARVIERQLRQVGAAVHVFGHQHRNRDRTVDGVRYVQHCVGNCREQREGWTYGLEDWGGPKQVWPPA